MELRIERVVWTCVEASVLILCCHEDKCLPVPDGNQYPVKVCVGVGEGGSGLGGMAYFCRVRLRLPVQLLILFWASRWFMPSVAMPSMDRTVSPTVMPPLAALPPSVSCRDRKKKLMNKWRTWPAAESGEQGGSRWCGTERSSLYLSHDLWVHSITEAYKLIKDLLFPAHDGGSAGQWCTANSRSLRLLPSYLSL